MTKWASYGCGPQNDPEAIQSRQEEDDLLRRNLRLILANSDRIDGTPRYFFCQLRTAYLSSPWIFGGGGSIPLGVLLLLWKVGEMIFDCPGCEGKFHAEGISGSILSGCGSAWGHCLDCNEWQKIRRDHMGRTILAVGPLLRAHRNEPVIQKGKQPRFDWKDGLVGESTPDTVIVPAVEPVDLRTLVAELGGSHLEVFPRVERPRPDSKPKKKSMQPIGSGLTYPIPLEKKRR
jgi:hypothetical protein